MSKAAELANLIGNINAGGGGVNRNVIINGAMTVAQRGTSATGLGTSDGYNTIDRMRLNLDGANAGRFTMSQSTDAPAGFANSLKFECTTADTSIAAGERLDLEQRIEGRNMQAFAKGTSSAKPFAVSFYVKGNASATYSCELFDGDNSRQVQKLFNVTTDWTRIELSFPADTTGVLDNDSENSFLIIFHLHGGSTYTSGTLDSTWATFNNANRAVGISSFFDSTARTFFITGLQIEVGQNPTEFEHEPFEKTLLKCQRYFYRYIEGNGKSIMTAAAILANHIQGNINFPTTMRSTPSLATSTGTNYWEIYSSGSYAFNSLGGQQFHPNGCTLLKVDDITVSAGHSGIVYTSNASATIDLDAEL